MVKFGCGGKSTKKLRVDHVREQLFLFSPPKQQTQQPPIALSFPYYNDHTLYPIRSMEQGKCQLVQSSTTLH